MPTEPPPDGIPREAWEAACGLCGKIGDIHTLTFDIEKSERENDDAWCREVADTAAPPMTARRAIDELDTIDDAASTAALDAERIILAFLRDNGHAKVADAFEAVGDRCGHWFG